MSAVSAGDLAGILLLAAAGWIAAAGRGSGGRPRRRPLLPQSKIGSLVLLRFSSKKPSVLATSSTPSQSFAAASPRGMGETTGPKNDAPATEMTGVPTS